MEETVGFFKLRPGQVEAIENMHNGCILCGDVGSGKSRTALAYYYKEMEGDIYADDYIPMGDPPKDLYIITTAHKRDLHEWEEEMVPFLIGKYCDNFYQHNVVVDSWNNIQKYKNVIGAFFIFDEQRVVGSGAWVKAFLKIARGNKWILLSATPGDTWMDYVPVFVANGFYRNKTEFKQEHVVWKPYTKFPQIDRYIGTGKLERYRRQLLVEIPEERHTIQHHEDVYVSYDIGKYKDLIRKRWNPYTDEPIENGSEFCYTQRRIVNEDESRQEAVLELFERHPKLIVFYNFDYELDILRTIFKDRFNGVTVAEWNGHKHEKVPDTGSWVYLVQYTAGCEGWNCIKTDAMVFYSQNYSYKVTKQASGRIDRMTSPFTDLWYYHLRSRSGIDLQIGRALAEKKDFNARKYYSKYGFGGKENDRST